MKKLSVIIPVYNVEAYLAKCLDSILTVPSADYEIIIVNDGSTDDSIAVAEQYRRMHPSLIRVITTENQGQGSARNVGISLAEGEFLYFIDSDDYLAEGGMQGILSCLDEEFDILIFDSIAVTGTGKQLKYMAGCTHTGSLSLKEHPGLILEGPDVWNKIFRRSLWIESGVRFPTRVWFEDLRAVPKLYYYTDRILYRPEAWHRYLQRYNSVTNTTKAMRNREIIPAVDDVISFYRAKGMGETLKAELEYLAFYCQFLTSSVRANNADWNSPVQEELMQDFLTKFPDYRKNPYVCSMPRKHKLLTFLLLHRMRLSVHILMKLNTLVKGKTSG